MGWKWLALFQPQSEAWFEWMTNVRQEILEHELKFLNWEKIKRFGSCCFWTIHRSEETEERPLEKAKERR